MAAVGSRRFVESLPEVPLVSANVDVRWLSRNTTPFSCRSTSGTSASEIRENLLLDPCHGLPAFSMNKSGLRQTLMSMRLLRRRRRIPHRPRLRHPRCEADSDAVPNWEEWVCVAALHRHVQSTASRG
jgi:hypothetical protein